MKGRTVYFMIAILLTILNAAVAVYYGTAIWTLWSGDILGLGFSVFLAALGATSLVKVWVQAILESGASPGSRTIECGECATQVSAEVRGHCDV